MSFDVVCPKCGAPSSPSTGTCPFCKASFAVSAGPLASSLALIQKNYEAGKLSEALFFATNLSHSSPEYLDDPAFIMLFVKILIETEGAESKINSLLSRILLKDPDHAVAHEYLDVVEAKSHFTKGLNDPGEIALQKILRRSPDNVHALFLLGTHMYWNNGDPFQAAKYLEHCVQLRHNFLRAWACLGAIYKKLGNKPLSSSAFQRCVSLESDQNMKKFFQEQLN